MQQFKDVAPDLRRWALVRIDGRVLLSNFPKRVAIDRLGALASVLSMLGNEMSRQAQRGESSGVWVKYRIFGKDEPLWLIVKPVRDEAVLVAAFYSMTELGRQSMLLDDNLERLCLYLPFVLADAKTLPPLRFLS